MNWKNRKPRGTHRSVTSSKQRRSGHAERLQTAAAATLPVPTASLPPFPTDHSRSLLHHRPPPCATIKGASWTRVSPFSPPSPPRHPALCHYPAYHQAPRWSQLSPSLPRPADPSSISGTAPCSSLTQSPAASIASHCVHRRFTSARTATAVESSIR
jgi:hypothetical protein